MKKNPLRKLIKMCFYFFWNFLSNFLEILSTLQSEYVAISHIVVVHLLVNKNVSFLEELHFLLKISHNLNNHK